MLLSGDVPALQPSTLESLVHTHASRGAALTVLTAQVPNPHGYGRIVREDGELARIVEEKDATDAQRTITEINAGIYAFDMAGLFDAVHGIGSSNAQGEYYLTDLVGIYKAAGRVVTTVSVADPSDVLGVNSRAEQALLGALLRQRKNAALMASGVTLEDPATTYIDADVEVGADTVISMTGGGQMILVSVQLSDLTGAWIFGA